MSRAFVKEVDDAPPQPVAERPVSGAPNLVTPRGAQLIEQAVAALETSVASSNDETALLSLRRDLRYWHTRRSNMKIVAPVAAPQVVGFGVRVRISRKERTSVVGIVGEDEAEPSAGLIAWTAPLARALDGARPGETVELEIGGRLETVTVLAITARDGE
jgi:transcription elongation GreA/GreB family factor